MPQFDILPMATALSALALAPLFLIITTCFLKIAVVLVIVRNALGVQQVPPTMAIYGIALALTIFIMAPVFSEIEENLSNEAVSFANPDEIQTFLTTGLQPLKTFMKKHTDPEVESVLKESTDAIWNGRDMETVDKTGLLLAIPSFIISEVHAGFKIGFLIYLPFIVVDILVSNILLALGMQMVSPMTISMPLKILLFVVANGWERLLQSLILTYV